MNNGFIKKAVEPSTVGNMLKKLREISGKSIEEISEETKIQTKYLKWLEEDNYKRLPARVYVEGFLKSYAKFLNEDPSEIIMAFRKEEEIRSNIGKKNEQFYPIKPLKNSRPLITPRIIASISALFLIFAGGFYLYTQASFIFSPPDLKIYSPSEDKQTSKQDMEVSGKTSAGAQIFINGQTVFTDPAGNFKENISLQEGLNVLKISSENRTGKKSETIRNILLYSNENKTNEASR